MRERGGGGEVSVGKILRDWRQAWHLRQGNLATKLHRAHSYLSKYERVEHTLTLPEREETCEALGYPLRQFIIRCEASSSSASV